MHVPPMQRVYYQLTQTVLGWFQLDDKTVFKTKPWKYIPPAEDMIR